MGLLLFLGLLVPVIEESLKTAAIWPFLPAGLSSDEAFLGGALGGAGFALAEALFVTQPMAGWVVTAVARSGATLMHALATGLACWGLAEALTRRRWLEGGVALLSSIVLHGLWNISAVAIGLSQLTNEGDLEASAHPAAIAGAGLLLFLSSLAAAALPGILRRFRARRLTAKG